MVPLGELCTILSGGTPSKANPAFWKGDIPWVSGKDLKKPRLADVVDHISADGLVDGSRLAPAGSVLLLVRGMGLAKDLPVSVALRPMAFNQDVKALVPKRDVSGAFLRAAIYHAKDQLLSRIVPSAHGTMTLNLDDIETLRIPVPDQSEDSEQVATALELLMQAADTSDAEVDRALALKQVTMSALFTRGLRSEPQKETDIGPIPESWNLVRFGSTREWLQYGTSVRCTTERRGLPVLRIPNIEPGRVNSSDLKFAELASEDAARYRLENGDLIFIRTNGVVERLGACAVYAGDPAEARFASYLIRARLKLNLLVPAFAAHFFGSERGTSLIATRATPAADGKYNLNTGTIDSLPIALPTTLDEQHEIVEVLDAIDRKIELHRKKRAVLDDLFNSLLHKLMTGEIRVVDLDLSTLTSTSIAGAAS